MKLSTTVNKSPILIEVDGGQFFVKRFTIKEVQDLQKEIQSIQDKAPKALSGSEEDLDNISDEDIKVLEAANSSLIMFLFEKVLVGDDGMPFEEVQAGLTYEALTEILPVSTLQKLPEAVMGAIAGKTEGN